jgi:hypothetical protein
LLLPDISKIQDVKVFHSASVKFFAPSDESGIRGMHREYLRCTPNWMKRGHQRRDCVLVNMDDQVETFEGKDVARIKLFFSFKYLGETFPCAFVEWFEKVSNFPDPLTNMWRVKPEKEPDGHRKMSVIHMDTVIRSVLLAPEFGSKPLPPSFHYKHSLDGFNTYYVNKYGDAHLHELLSK